MAQLLSLLISPSFWSVLLKIISYFSGVLKGDPNQGMTDLHTIMDDLKAAKTPEEKTNAAANLQKFLSR